MSVKAVAVTGQRGRLELELCGIPVLGPLANGDPRTRGNCPLPTEFGDLDRRQEALGFSLGFSLGSEPPLHNTPIVAAVEALPADVRRWILGLARVFPPLTFQRLSGAGSAMQITDPRLSAGLCWHRFRSDSRAVGRRPKVFDPDRFLNLRAREKNPDQWEQTGSERQSVAKWPRPASRRR